MPCSKVVYGGKTLIDLTNVTVTADTLADGVIALDAAGNEVVGTMPTLATIMKTVYPVGAVYTSTVATDPKTLFGFGTWERIQDRFLLAAGSTYPAGATGGEATHKLTVDEMPSHNHTGKGWANITDGSGTYYVLGANGKSTTYSTNVTGGGAAHNNMPPYLAVYVWKRTA